MATVFLGASSMFSQAYKNNKQVARKLETVSLENNLKTLLGNDITCGCNLQNLSFSSSAKYTPITKPLRWGCENDSTIAVQPGSPLAGSQEDIYVEKMGLVNVEEISPDIYRGQIEVSFAVEKGKTSLKPLRIQQYFNIDTDNSSENTKIIAGCGKAAEPGPITDLSCNNSEHLGFDNNGNVACKSPDHLSSELNCATEEVIGFDASGNTVCVANSGNNGGNGGTVTCPCGPCYAVRNYAKSHCGNDEPYGNEQCLPVGWTCISNDCGCTSD